MGDTELNATPPEGTPAGEPTPPATPPETPPEPDKGGVQRRIDELTRKRREAEREAAYWRGVAEAKKEKEVETSTHRPAPTDELDPNDFDSDAEYLKAVAAKTAESIKRDIEAERDRERKLSTQNQLTSLYNKGRKDYPDFDDVALDPSVPITQQMFDAAMGDKLPDVLYHLGKNPAEASRIASLTPTQQIKEIGKIESGLTKKTTTGAPPPPSTVGAGSSGPPKEEKDMTRSELHAKWEKERRARLGIRS